MLSYGDLRLAECPRHGSLLCAPPHLRRCGARGATSGQDPRSAQQPGQAVRGVSVSPQQTARRQHAHSHTFAGQRFVEASVAQPSSDSKVSGRCPPNAVMDLHGSTNNSAEAAVPTEHGQSRGMAETSSQPHSRDSIVQLRASTGIQEPSTQLALWCWEWANTRWRASFFFLMASVAFVIGSGASLQPHIFAGKLRSVHFCPGKLHCLCLLVCLSYCSLG